MLLRQSEVERKYRLSRTTLHRWLKEGKLTERRTVGGHRRYDSAEIEALLLRRGRSREEDADAENAKS